MGEILGTRLSFLISFEFKTSGYHYQHQYDGSQKKFKNPQNRIFRIVAKGFFFKLHLFLLFYFFLPKISLYLLFLFVGSKFDLIYHLMAKIWISLLFLTRTCSQFDEICFSSQTPCYKKTWFFILNFLRKWDLKRF